MIRGRVLALIEQHKVTTLSGVPTTFQMLCEDPSWAGADLASLEKLTCGGSAVPARVIDAYEARGVGFSNCYGMTEIAPGATMLPAQRSREKTGAAGLSHFFTDVRIVAASGSNAGPGETGEIQISGPHVIKEYWNRSEATQASYADSLWFRSGDIGHVDDEGFLFVSDRLKDMIISELDEVASVAVIGIHDEKWGEIPRAIITLREGAILNEDDVRKHLDGRLARYKIPKSVIFTDDMPRAASGKIRKVDLRNQYCN